MDVIAYAAGTIVFVIVIGFVVAAVLSSSAQARKDELQTRHIARQPWDAHSADGRGNR